MTVHLAPATFATVNYTCNRPGPLLRHHRGAVALSNLPVDMSEADLVQLAQGLPLVGASLYGQSQAKAAAGSATGAAVAGAAGPSSRLGFLLFNDMSEVQHAVRRLHLTVVGGRQIRAMAVR
jgi:hypothetical protein